MSFTFLVSAFLANILQKWSGSRPCTATQNSQRASHLNDVQAKYVTLDKCHSHCLNFAKYSPVCNSFYWHFSSLSSLNTHSNTVTCTGKICAFINAPNDKTQYVGYGYGGFRGSVGMGILWRFPRVFLCMELIHSFIHLLQKPNNKNVCTRLRQAVGEKACAHNIA